MPSNLPQIYLARHGETAWSLSGQHTGHTDIPLTPQGEKNAQQLGERLEKKSFTHVYSSPLQRAMKTAALAGFKDLVQPEPYLLEWNYGEYEGLTTKEILQKKPDWLIFKDGCPGGESPNQVATRCDQLIQKIKSLQQEAPGDILLFAHSHILRMLATRWLDLPANDGRFYLLSTASLSILGYEHNSSEPVIRLWNDTSHLQ
ncbi:MAG: histidine phosphatase family protein [Verrucomicrobiae bacterium]|jgi:probable phosphoglycerate mutase|nr:histidine phosphatase family protein [Verrucomicrobiae bacterium]